MNYPEDSNSKETFDETEEQHLILDGTVNPNDGDDGQVPRVKGLIELLNQYFGNKKKQNY